MLSLKRKMHIFFSHKRKLQIRLLLLTDTDVGVLCAVLVGMGSFTPLQSPTFETELCKS